MDGEPVMLLLFIQGEDRGGEAGEAWESRVFWGRFCKFCRVCQG